MPASFIISVMTAQFSPKVRCPSIGNTEELVTEASIVASSRAHFR